MVRILCSKSHAYSITWQILLRWLFELSQDLPVATSIFSIKRKNFTKKTVNSDDRRHEQIKSDFPGDKEWWQWPWLFYIIQFHHQRRFWSFHPLMPSPIARSSIYPPPPYPAERLRIQPRGLWLLTVDRSLLGLTPENQKTVNIDSENIWKPKFLKFFDFLLFYKFWITSESKTKESKKPNDIKNCQNLDNLNNFWRNKEKSGKK